MKPLPATEYSLFLRTHFADDAAWEALCAMVRAPSDDEFCAYVTPVSDPAYTEAAIDDIVRAAGRGNRTFLFVADKEAFDGAEHPVLVIDLLDEPGRTFRVIPSKAWSVQNNLSIANMGFEEFAEAVDEGGIFRGFPG